MNDNQENDVLSSQFVGILRPATISVCGEVIVNSLHSCRCLLEDKLVQLSYFAGGILSNILLDWTDEDLLPMSLKLLMLVKLVRTPERGPLTKFYTGTLRLEVQTLVFISGGGARVSRALPFFQTKLRSEGPKKFFGDRAPPPLPPLSQGLDPALFLYTILDRKGSPFVYLLLTNGTLFTYLQAVRKFSTLLTAVNALSLKYESITQPK